MNLRSLFQMFLAIIGLTLLGGSLTAQPLSIEVQLAAADDHADKGRENHSEGSDHASHDEEGEEEGVIRLTAAQVALAEIISTAAQTGTIASELTLNGEVTLPQDRVAEIVPRVPGVVEEVLASLGAEVAAGETLAVIQSRELADGVADYLAARERLALAQSRFTREETLWKKKISPEQEFLEVRQALVEARIEQRTTEQKLRALGMSSSQLQALSERPTDAFTRYSLNAPFAGTIIERHVTQGEQVNDENPLFRIAQLDRLWVIASVYPKDIASIKNGQSASVTVQSYPSKRFTGTVTWLASVIDQQTRTLPIRIELDNHDGLLKAGMFARIAVSVSSAESALVVPRSAVQMQKGEVFVFIDKGNGEYERREVSIGSESSDAIEIIKGVNHGEKVVSQGAFTLKSEFDKAGFEAGHGH